MSPFVKHLAVQSSLSLVLFLSLSLEGMTLNIHAQVATPPPPSARVPWNASRVQGVPDPPPPYALERVFPNLSFQGPVSLHAMPQRVKDEVPRLVVVEQSGKIFSFEERNTVSQMDLMLDLASPPPKLSEFDRNAKHNVNAYSLAFHPNFKENRFVYVCYVVLKPGGIHQEGTHIARYQVTTDNPPKIDYDSETTIMRFVSGGHNGCALEFGPDGYLYISIGDIADPTPPDPYKTGQDISDLYSSILRIDVDRPSKNTAGNDLAYTIPPDNPFVKLPKARGEVYAFGFRNPWRMGFDRSTGDLWVGDVGWEAYEMVYRVRSGGNYGWSIKEGPGDVMPDLPIGPSPISPPDIWFGHSDAASVTGGFVYRGDRLPGLRGKYVFGDWITRRYWAATFDAQRVTHVQEIAGGEVKPICFALDSKGELLVLEYIQWDQKGGLYRFVPNPAAEKFEADKFPTLLSQTGLFRDLKNLEPNEGVAEYELNSTMWMDGAEAVFHLAIPGADAANIFQSPQDTFDWFKTKVKFPKGTVLAKTYSMKHAGSNRKIETQLSHYEGPNDWRFYTYQWNDEQTDAKLVPASGATQSIRSPSDNPDEDVELRWVFAARNQCRTCHTPWSGDAIGFVEEQLRQPEAKTDAWRKLVAQGLLKWHDEHQPKPDSQFSAMANLHDQRASLNVRARSYLQSNCAHCHQFGGNGAANFDIRFEKSLLETKAIDVMPIKGQLQLENAMIIAPGDPGRSVLLYRMAKTGSGRMPHIGAETVDRNGVKLMSQWILSQPREEQHRNWLDELTSPMQKINVKERLRAAQELLATPRGALLLIQAINDNAIPPATRSHVLELANLASENSRDVIEPYLPPKQRQIRLGAQFDKDVVLRTQGNAEQGKLLLMNGVGQCVQCHRFGDKGKDTGPPLKGIGIKYPERYQLLDQLMNPSTTIAPGYRAITILTSNNETIVGRVLERNDKQVVLALADGTRRELPTNEIEQEKESNLSLMPEGLLAALTAKQASDILEYLRTLKEE